MEAIVFYLLMHQMYQFKTKVTEIKLYTLCLGNISKGFAFDNRSFFL